MYFFTFLIAYALCGSVMGRSILDECVNETLVLDESCYAKPEHVDFFQVLHTLIKGDTALIVLEVSFPNTDIHHRFDLVKTEFGETLLMLKGQMEFMTLDLPLLSDKIYRQRLSLVQYPRGCADNVRELETALRNWLLCGLTIKQGGVTNVYKLLVNKLCIAKPYIEPDDWYLFKDTFYHECCDEPSIHSTCSPLIEDVPIAIFKKTLNFGVTSATILSMILLFAYRGFFCTKAHIYLYKLHKSQKKICEIVDSTVGISNVVTLFPNMNRMEAHHCAKYIRKWKFGDQYENRLSRKVDAMAKGKAHEVNISGYWLDIKKDVLISYNSFGILFLLKVIMDEFSAKNNCKDRRGLSVWKRRRCLFGRYVYYVLDMACSLAILCVGCYLLFKFYLSDPFHTLLDAIACVALVVIGPVLSIVIRSTLGFCDNKLIDMIQSVLHEMVFIFLSYTFVAVFGRVIVILLIGLSLQSGANVFTLVASAMFFVLANGYFQLKRTHEIYVDFLKVCINHISSCVDETGTLSDPVYRERLVSSETTDDIVPGKQNTLILKLDRQFLLYYTENGEPAMNLDFYLDLCKSDISYAPGHLKMNTLIDAGKFMYWSGVVVIVIYLQHVISREFDYSLFDHAPATMVTGLLPYVLMSVLFPKRKIEKHHNVTRLMNDAVSKYNKQFLVTDMEIQGEPHIIQDDQTGSTPEEMSAIYVDRKGINGTPRCCISGKEHEAEEGSELQLIYNP